ncbi:MAG: hypothetical protein ACRC5H_05610, partial [Treponemataceae bacterium]
MEENKFLVEKDFVNAVDNIDLLLNKSYLSSLDHSVILQNYQMVDDNTILIDEFNKTIRFFDITQIVLNKNE